MKRKMIVITMALACLLQQGCYTVVNRDGEYFASTKYANEEIGRDNWFKGHTMGDAIFWGGFFVPFVGPFILWPIAIVVHPVECYVIAPAFDILCLPYDCINDYENHQKESEKEKHE